MRRSSTSCSRHRSRAFATNMKDPVYMLVWFYNQRAGAENLIKEANNDAGLAAYPSARWAMNRTIFDWPCWPTT